MAHHLTWPGKYFFYPIGNTLAVPLTRDLAPEEDANLLLLGCGDPRHVLYTLYTEPLDSERKLDFTCCDLEPAILARNIILLTMVLDNYPSQTIWNVFFHMKFDPISHESLRIHCEKLLKLSENIKSWNASPYGSCLRFCADYTRIEIRHCWSLYATMYSLPESRLKQIAEAFRKMQKVATERSNLTALRSRGPLFLSRNSIVPIVEQSKNYWNTGTTFTSSHQTSLATLINPTFVYCLVGEGCCVQYGTDPLTPFHLAEATGTDIDNLEIADLVQVAQKQFRNWCSAYRAVALSSKQRLVLRFITGDALAVSHAFRHFTETRGVKTSVTCAPWKSSRIELYREEYLSQNAPSMFDVVETSNLDDHIGLLNVLISASFVLVPNGVLYSESLLYRADNDATKDFNERLYADIALMGLLLRLCPIDYLSSFNSRSNTHELMAEKVMRKMGNSSPQFHQVTTWKSPTSGDVRASPSPILPEFDPIQLGNALWDIYHRIFELDDAKTFFERLSFDKKKITSTMRTIMQSGVIHYTRETFVFFLKAVRNRLCIHPEQWFTVMDRFFQIQISNNSMPMDTVNSQELYGLLHTHGLFTVEIYRDPMPYLMKRVGRFAKWPTVPPVVQIVFTIPRNKLDVLVWPDPKDTSAPSAMTFPLQCYVRGVRMANTFSAVNVAFGRVSRIQTSESTHPRIAFEEDGEGWGGSAPLVAAFFMPTQLLMFHEPQYLLSVHLVVHVTPGRELSPTMEKLDSDCSIFRAEFLDEEIVHVLPADLAVGSKLQGSKYVQRRSVSAGKIGQSGHAVVELNEDGSGVSSFTSHIDINSEEVINIFAGGEMPRALQTSSCIMQLELGKFKQDIAFPFPISGSGSRLRLARKSHWIEVVVPPCAPFQPDAIKVNPFPVVGTPPALTSWNIHRISLDFSPILKRDQSLDEWLDAHIGSMMSARERSLRVKGKKDVQMSLKNSLHSLFVRFSGVQDKDRPQIFGLYDDASNSCDTILFAKELRFDLASHTVVCDAYILPLTVEITENAAFPYLIHKSGMKHIRTADGEMVAWKHLLPATVERCRKWKHNLNCEYKATGKIPLSERIGEVPLCSCGRGKDVEGMKTERLWRPFASYSWRIALSPLFGVSYLERILGSSHKCHRCRGKGNPKLQICGECHKTRYCSRECQKADWQSHKQVCKA